jgi:hypothetical protein
LTIGADPCLRGGNEGFSESDADVDEVDEVKVNSRGTVRPNFEGERERRDPEDGSCEGGGAKLARRAGGRGPPLPLLEEDRLADKAGGGGKANDLLGLRVGFCLEAVDEAVLLARLD